MERAVVFVGGVGCTATATAVVFLVIEGAGERRSAMWLVEEGRESGSGERNVLVLGAGDNTLRLDTFYVNRGVDT